MKRLFALLLAAFLLLSCTGCGFVEGFQEGFEEGFNNALEDAAQEANKEITRGVIAGNVYTSNYSGLTFQKPESWVYSSDEEMAQTFGISTDDLIDNSSFAAAVGKMASVYDMMVVDYGTGSSVSVYYENLNISNGGDMTAEAYMEAMKGQLANQTQMGYVFDTEITAVTLSGKEYLRLGSSVDYSGIPMKQYYYVRNLGSIMNGIVVTLVGDTLTVADIEAMFR